MFNRTDELLKKKAKIDSKIKENPLSQYTTSELKRELRRRKALQ
ncbi:MULTISPECIES: hypothetical protein [Clostridium]|uniref:Fur-regulated basic protein B n=1 Tax=Clostridium frigoriphilum TaxID=443253 RepID=A0ABU7UHL7_9CLOT|nr:hypothetical protein [Clostridium sp. DSM 17811]